MARLAIAKSFLAKYASLDKGVRSAVDVAIAEFAGHPDPGECLERPRRGRDDRIRTLEVNGRWSGVVLVPASGDIYCLVTVLPRDMAQAYAASRRFSVNPALGVLESRDEEAIQRLQPAPPAVTEAAPQAVAEAATQAVAETAPRAVAEAVVQAVAQPVTQAATAPVIQAAAQPAGRRLFADVSDADLTRLGVDDQVLPKIRLLASEGDLERLEAALPEAQYAALYALASGMTVDEAWEQVTQLHSPDPPIGAVDPDDLASAMERSPGQVTFVSGQEELQFVLSHPFAQWRTFLHPSQRKIAYRASYSGPAQVTGGPGTGKTVTVLHRAAFLAANEADQVLVTSFNGILADALAAQLDMLIPNESVRRRIEVLNVDRLAYAIVKAARGIPAIADERMVRALWADAAADTGLDFTPAFMKNEWEQVILAQDLSSEQAYLTCLRAGRGRSLTKAQRSQVWRAAQRVTEQLGAARQSTHLQLANEAAHLLGQAEAPRYRHVLVDEAQDLHPCQWRLLRAAVALGPDDLFLAGDPHQRIYNSRISLASLGISVRGRSHRLSLSYRTTQEILAWAVPLLGGEPVTGLDGEVDSLIGYRSPMHGAPPQLRVAATRAEEFGWLTEQIRSWLALGIEPQAIGMTARSAELVREAREALKADGIATTPLGGRGGGQTVRAGTMHAMKGLEFQAVAVVGVERGLVPEPAAVTAEAEDPVAYAQDVLRERCTLFVACTRARDHLYVSGAGELSLFLPPAREAEPPAREAEPPHCEAEPPAREAEPLPRQAEPPAREAEPSAREAEPPAREAEPLPRQAEPPAREEVPTAREKPAAREEQAACVEPAASEASSIREEQAAEEEPPAPAPAGPRRISMQGLLQLREDAWRPRLAGASLLAEVELRPAHTSQVAAVLGRLYGSLQDPRTEGESFLLRWPACLAAAMGGVAATDYRDGAYWSALWEAAEYQGTREDQETWGGAFTTAIARLGMATFPGLPLPRLGPILMHAGIPAPYLGDYFKLLLSRRQLDRGMDAEGFLAWATAPGRDSRLAQLNKPARRFLRYGGDYAHDIVERTLDLLDRFTEPDPDFNGVRLPGYMIEAAKAEIAAGHLELPGHPELPGAGQRAAGGQGVAPSGRQVQPQIALDPYGQGVHVLLPAVGEAPDGVARWQVTADGDTHTVQSRAMWTGATGTTPAAAYPLGRPARTVVVSLAGCEDLAAEFRVVDQADPVLFFNEDGRRLSSTVSLPRSQVWIMHPAERELDFAGQAGQVTEPAVPFGWDGWRLRLVSLENVQAVGLRDGRPHPVEARARPRLLLDDPLPGVTTPSGWPVYPAPPRLELPQGPGTDIVWHAEIRRAGGGAPLVSRVVGPSDQAGLWDGVPRPLLGAFEVTVRGPLGRGLRRAVFVAEGLIVAYQPDVRLLAKAGLEAGTAQLTAAAGAAAQPATLRFGPAERAHLVEYRTDAGAEPVVVTPPHVSVLCPGAGVTSWTTSLIHLAAEDFADAGRLLIRVPAAARPGQETPDIHLDELELAVFVRGKQVQAITASGQRSPGLDGFELPRAIDTVAAHGRAGLALDMGAALMPLGYVRARRLASGADLSAGKLVLRDAPPVDGLTAGVYLPYAPWRPPAELAVAADGSAALPAELRDAGPLRVLLRIGGPWTAPDWPAWPRSDAYACPAAGVPASADAEEESLSRFVAGEADLPPLANHLGWLWRLVDLAADLVEAGARGDLAERVTGELLRQPRAALLALADEGLRRADVVHALIATGMAAAGSRPPAEDSWTEDERRALERLWAVQPAAAAVAVGGDLFRRDEVSDAAVSQCGDAFAAILDGHPDPCAAAGRLEPEDGPPERADALRQAAVVPGAMLDADTRLAAAWRIFDARHEPPMQAAASSAKTIIQTAEMVISHSRYPDLADAIAERKPPEGAGWPALPAMSIAMALLARLAARGNSNCAPLEREHRGTWADLARHAPDLVATDIVLAEALVAAAWRKSEQPAMPGESS